MLKVIDLKESKLELRAYDIEVSTPNETAKIDSLRTDSEHHTAWGIFLHDPEYTGEASTLDTKSRISCSVNGERVVENAHACLFLANKGVSLEDTAWKFKVPIQQSEISIEYKDAAKYAAENYPRTVTLYLICEKKK